MNEKEKLSTVQYVFETLKESCTLKKVLKPVKPCPFYGASGDCVTCTNEWMSTVNEILKHIHAKRLNIDLEKEKRRSAEESYSKLAIQNDALVKMVNHISTAFGKVHNLLDDAVREEFEKESFEIEDHEMEHPDTEVEGFEDEQ